jgi:photosystem II stability/assembly factor-like uncharacterized protein
MYISRRLAGVMLAVLVAAAAAGAFAAEKPTAAKVPWTPLGMGGAGGVFAPAISPHDGNLVLLSCDMGGFYRTTDGGKSWTMLSFRQIRGNCDCAPVFHPTDPNTVFAGDGYDNARLVVSHDKGATWQPLIANAPWGQAHITALAVDRVNGNTMLVGTDEAAFLSADGGKTWRRCNGPAGKIIGFHVVKSSKAGDATIITAGAKDIWRSADGGKTWTSRTNGIPWGGLTGFAGGDDAAAGKTVLFVTIPSKAVNGAFAGGIYRSEDLGDSWQSAMGKGTNITLGKADEWAERDIAEYRHVAMPPDRTDTVYVSAYGTGVKPPFHDTIYVSHDAGNTWKYCFTGDPRWEGHNVETGWYAYDVMWDQYDAGLACDATGKVAIHSGGKVFITRDGGDSWRQIYSEQESGQGAPARGQRWHGIGLEVTTTWDYVIDPTDPKRHYICYTDIGFARSLDAGKNWILSRNGSAWENTCYGIACDGAHPGVIYGAWSNVHDLPHPSFADVERRKGPGGVCVSADYGATWKPSSEGLPLGPVTSIILDPTSPENARVLYVTVCGYGVYRSADSGKHWTKKSSGLGVHGNMQTYMIRRWKDGTLYCSITLGAKRGGDTPADDAGLYISDDGAETWKKISSSIDVAYPCGFAVDPADKDTIYLCASNLGQIRSGGLYKTTDGGKTWRVVFSKESPAYEGRGLESFFVTLRLDDPRKVYYGTGTQGLMYSGDGGATWKPFIGLPFADIHRVTFDPLDKGAIYVTTFGGGVWHGPAGPDNE